MQAIAEPFVSAAEYLAAEEKSTVKHEYFNGRLYAMSGGSNTHALLEANAVSTLRLADAAPGGRCAWRCGAATARP